MRDSFLIFPRSFLCKSILVIGPSNTVSWTAAFSPSEWSTDFSSHQGPPIVKSVKAGKATCLRLLESVFVSLFLVIRGMLPVWNLLFLLPNVVTWSCQG